MEKLALIRLPYNRTLGAFRQYIPENLRQDGQSSRHVCVGAVYGDKAIGAGLIRMEDGPYLRWIFVDPAARCCGVGTYLLKGLLGAAGEAYRGEPVKCVFTSEMWENSRVPGILERVGFSGPQPVATRFSARLSELDSPGIIGEHEILPIDELPEDIYLRFTQALYGGELPAYLDYAGLEEPLRECCLACLCRGELAGLLLCERTGEGIMVRGVYIFPAFRQTSVTGALLAEGIRVARTFLPGDMSVYISAINRESFSLSVHVLPEHTLRKETEYRTEFRYPRIGVRS